MAPTVAIGVALLVQVPPAVASVRVVVAPTQTIAVPNIVAGIGLIVTIAVLVQPVPNE